MKKSRTRWTEEEDTKLINFAAKHRIIDVDRWIPKNLPGRSITACRARIYARYKYIKMRQSWTSEMREKVLTLNIQNSAKIISAAAKLSTIDEKPVFLSGGAVIAQYYHITI